MSTILFSAWRCWIKNCLVAARTPLDIFVCHVVHIFDAVYKTSTLVILFGEYESHQFILNILDKYKHVITNNYIITGKQLISNNFNEFCKH